jgi:hypothetical protein
MAMLLSICLSDTRRDLQRQALGASQRLLVALTTHNPPLPNTFSFKTARHQVRSTKELVEFVSQNSILKRLSRLVGVGMSFGRL